MVWKLMQKAEKFRVVGVKPDGFGMSVIELAVEWHT